MSKRPPKDRRHRHKILGFEVGQLFPLTDQVALDLLRLMAGYNDLAYITEWTDAHVSVPTDPSKRTLAAGRWFLQLRLITSLLHEILKTFTHLRRSPGFEALKARLDQEGLDAFERLRRVASGKEVAISALLHRTRDTVTFHYDIDVFKNGLQRLMNRYGTECRSTVVIRYTGSEVRPHYALADQIRTEIAFGLDGQGGLRPELVAATDLLGLLTLFLDRILSAYMEDRGLRGVFTETSAETE